MTAELHDFPANPPGQSGGYTGAEEAMDAPLPHVHGDYCSHPTQRLEAEAMARPPPLAAFIRASTDWWRAFARLWGWP